MPMCRRISLAIGLVALSVSINAMAQVREAGETFLEPLQQRDTALIADQFRYGVQVDSIMLQSDGLSLPDMSEVFKDDTLVLVRGWQLDTLGRRGGKSETKPHSIRASVLIAPFEEGTYHLPDIPVLRQRGGKVDTLMFKGQELEVSTIQIDTATFEIHDLKGQMRYPVTFRELLPYIGGLLLLAAIIVLIVLLVRRHKSHLSEQESSEPPYITALKALEKYRGDKYWAPDKQKAMYSGITDTLRTYIESRFEVNAEEMTTAEIFSALKGHEDIPEDLLKEVKALFELSDYVKFAKHTASDDDNVRAVPVAVRFVTTTYQAQTDAEATTAVEEDGVTTK